jgi:hypothetical protein
MDVEHSFSQTERHFARWVLWGSRGALALLVAGFFLYVTGVLPAHVPLAELPKLWGLPLGQFLAAAHAPSGWQWLALAGRGDYFNYLGIVVLCAIIIAAYLRVLPGLTRGERAFALIAALELVVLLTAASGLLNWISGGHP